LTTIKIRKKLKTNGWVKNSIERYRWGGIKNVVEFENQGITFGDPLEENLQNLNNRCIAPAFMPELGR